MNAARPVISLIWAMAENRVIGRRNKLPWHLPADLKHFKALTLGKPILMGRRTWESLPGLLPDRRHIVVTRDLSYRADGCIVVHSVDEALDAVSGAPELMVVGGGALYQAMLPVADRLYMTLVHADVQGDTLFPPFNPAEWEQVGREDHAPDERNPYPYSFVELRRKTD